MIFLVWLVLCYFVWPTVEILVTGSRLDVALLPVGNVLVLQGWKMRIRYA